MVKTKEEIIRSNISKDTYNREFVIKFNLAIQELIGDDKALVVFMNQVIPVMKQFAKQNNKTFDEFLDDMKKYDKGADLPEMEFKEQN